MTNNLPTIIKNTIPALSGSSLTYNPSSNMFLTTGYTSNAGNTYCKALRVSDRIVIAFNIGVGYCRTFLNGITMFCWDGRNAKIIGQRQWGGCNYKFFNEAFAKEQSIEMLKEYLTGQLKLSGRSFSDRDVAEFSRNLIEETQYKRLA